MSEQIEQKQSQITTNYQSNIEQDQSEVQAIQIIQRHQVYQTKILIKSGVQGQHIVEEGSNEVEVLQTNEMQEKMDYEQFHDQPLETVQISEDRKQLQPKIQENFIPKSEQFDQFNDVQNSHEDEKIEVNKQEQKITEKLSAQQPQQIKSNFSKNFAQYQNSGPIELKVQQKVQVKKQQPQKNEEIIKSSQKKKSKKKKQQHVQPLPIITADSEEGKKQILSDKKIKEEIKQMQQQKEEEGGQNNNNQGDQNNQNGQGKQKMMRQEPNEVEASEIKEQVSEIVDPGSIAAGLIIYEAQRERIASTLDYFLKFTAKHEKHTTSQKQLIMNVEDQIQKKKQAKTPLCNMLREYFEQYVNLYKNLYEKSYKYTKNEKMISANPMINMKEQLKGGIDELIFLRKSTGNEFNRVGDFIANNPQKNVVKLFSDYWKAVETAQAKHKEKKDEFFRKEKEFIKRISKVVKVYTKGKQGVSQQEDLFIQMTKYINQEQDYRKTLIEYGQSLVPLKKAFIKAEQVLYEELQVIFNAYKNQFRGFYSLHPKQFTLIEKMEKQIREKNTFQKLSDITDGDYVRSVLLNHEKNTVQQLNDREFQKVLALVHFEEITGNSIQLLKGTTSKSFQLKNKTQQVVDTISGNLLIFNKQTAQMKQKFIIKNINAKIVQQGVVEIDEIIKGLIFNSNRTLRITFRDNDRAEELICFLNQIHENIKENQLAINEKK